MRPVKRYAYGLNSLVEWVESMMTISRHIVAAIRHPSLVTVKF